MRTLYRLMVVMLLSTVLVDGVLAQAPVSVEFNLRAPGLSPSKAVYLTGDVPSLGNWDPRAVKMRYQGNQTWSAIVIIDRPMWVEYKYTLGDDRHVPADDEGQPLPNFRFRAQRQVGVDDQVRSWTDSSTVVRDIGQVTGEVRYHRHVRDRQLPARDVIVWLPRLYEIQYKKDYPVLYLQDGQELFDPATAPQRRDWQVDEAMTRLIEDDEIEPMIVVGIYNSDNRLAEYSPAEDGEAYIDFLIRTVKPLVDGRYRTRKGRSNTFVGGAAMGGLIAFAAAWKHPEIFGAVISMSPTFSIPERFDATPWFEERAGEKRSVFFYMDIGGVGAEVQLRPGIEEMVGHMEAWGYRWERDFVFVQDLSASHGATAWANRFPGALARTLRGVRRLEQLSLRRERHGLERRQVHMNPPATAGDLQSTRHLTK